jgi:hypothetical protein
VPLRSDGYAYFSVSDLSKDDRFSHLPYIAGSPNFRFYAGTPLLTKNNVPIGSVFVVGDRPRSPPTKFEIEFLGVMAQNVMEYLEMRRESELRKRSETMSKGLAAFVAGRSRLHALDNHGVEDAKVEPSLPVKSWADPEHVPETISEVGLANTHPTTAIRDTETKRQSNVELASLEASSGIDDAFLQTRTVENLLEEMPTQEGILTRASNILRESLDVDYTVLLDLISLDSVSAESSGASSIMSNDTAESHDEDSQRFSPGDERKESDRQSRTPLAKMRPSPSSRGARSEKSRATPAKLLDFSSSSTFPPNSQETGQGIGFKPPYYKD